MCAGHPGALSVVYQHSNGVVGTQLRVVLGCPSILPKNVIFIIMGRGVGGGYSRFVWLGNQISGWYELGYS